MRYAPLIVVVGLCAASNAADGAVVSSGAGGFVVREQVNFAGNAASAWKRLVDVGSWWDPRHTYSGRSSNLSLTLQPGSCWCEKLDGGGFVRHLEVVLVMPGKMLRLIGGLGPLQGTGATGALTFTLSSTSQARTTVVAEYAVVGYSPDGLTSLAAAVDEVLADQMKRFVGEARSLTGRSSVTGASASVNATLVP
jgi:hypothetical protein